MNLYRSKLERIPPDHAVSMIEGLTTICHYCLLDSASQVSVGLPAPTSNTITTDTASAGQILTNLIHVFNPSGNNRVSRYTQIKTLLRTKLK